MRNHRAAMRLSCLLGLPLLLTLPLAGCGGGGGNGGGGSGSSPSPAPAAPLSVSSTLPDGLTATLAEDKAAVPVGGSVVYTLTLTNNTSQSITFQSFSPLGYTGYNGGSIQIVNASNIVVYPVATSGVTPTGTAPVVTLMVAPGQSLTQTLSPGNAFSSSGNYAATASFSFYASSIATVQTTNVGPLTVTAQ